MAIFDQLLKFVQTEAEESYLHNKMSGEKKFLTRTKKRDYY